MSDQGFTDLQKRYLEGFTSGLQIASRMRGLSLLAPAGPSPAVNGGAAPTGPEAIHFEAQNRFLAEGQKLTNEEKAKREKHPLDRWDELLKRAEASEFPKGTDVFCTKFFGLFYVAPAQDSYMCRLRLPNGILNSYQLRGVADLAESYGGGYSHVTTRANLQVREIRAKDGPAFLMGLYELGIVNRGAGADNIRNITGSPTAGIDPKELIDTRPLAKELHYYILNHRDLYGLPRKFNIAFDGSGAVSVLEDTNDIGFAAVRVGEGKEVKPGVYFRLQLGGITGHKDFARDTGILLKPEECLPVGIAIVRVFIEHGDRTDRTKARLKYLLDKWGFERFLAETERHLPFKLTRFPLADCEPRPPLDELAHIGFHRQKQEGLYYMGVVLPVGKVTVAQMRGLAEIADAYGSGMIRLTVWQNLLISDIREQDLEAVKAAVKKLGLDWSATSIRAGLVACTGNTGCKFSASNTKLHAEQIAQYLEARLALDQPINIHLTGCHHSCAQHYIGDIGLLACKIAIDEARGEGPPPSPSPLPRGREGVGVRSEETEEEGYHVFVGGGYGKEAIIARELRRNVPAEEAPAFIEKLMRAYLAHRCAAEPFGEFVRRYSPEQLNTLIESQEAAAA